MRTGVGEDYLASSSNFKSPENPYHEMKESLTQKFKKKDHPKVHDPDIRVEDLTLSDLTVSFVRRNITSMFETPTTLKDFGRSCLALLVSFCIDIAHKRTSSLMRNIIYLVVINIIMFNQETMLIGYQTKFTCIVLQTEQYLHDLAEHISTQVSQNFKSSFKVLNEIDLVVPLKHSLQALVDICNPINAVLNTAASAADFWNRAEGDRIRALNPLKKINDLLDAIDSAFPPQIIGPFKQNQIFADTQTLLREFDKIKDYIDSIVETARTFRLILRILTYMQLFFVLKRSFVVTFGVKKKKNKRKGFKKFKEITILWLKKSVNNISFVVFTVTMLVFWKFMFDFSKYTLAIGGVPFNHTLDWQGELNFPKDPNIPFSALYRTLEQLSPRIQYSANFVALECKVYTGEFQVGNMGLLVFMYTVYLLLPIVGIFVTPLKRSVFQYEEYFWIADKDIFVENGADCSCCLRCCNDDVNQ